MITKQKSSKIDRWLRTIIIGGIIWAMGEVAFMFSTNEIDLSQFGWIGRSIGIIAIIVGVYLKVRPKKLL